MIKVLLLADTHLGFDLPSRPRVQKRRRGPDFFANTRRALEPALRREVDIVVHGGDLLYRSKVPAGLVTEALEPLLEVADAGVPVVLVPGNHERSVLPYPMLAAHRNLHLIDRPRTFEFLVGETRVAVAGFPCQRKRVRETFADLVHATDVHAKDADVRLLCLHQTVEGARVKGYTFRRGEDIVKGKDIPPGFAAVLSGHIHRAQVLTHDLAGRPMEAPVIYPGSIERTSMAEKDEPKGFMILEIEGLRQSGGVLSGVSFEELPARPMFSLTIDASGLHADALADAISDELGALPDGAVVQLRIDGEFEPGADTVIRAANLRDLHPTNMTVDLRFRRGPTGFRKDRR